jgi:Tol biopolymer transport system component
MNDQTDFEARLRAALDRYAGHAALQVDATAVVAAATARRSIMPRTWSLAPARGWASFVLLGLLLAAVIGGALLVGARLFQSPPPHAVLGRLAYALDGDIYVAEWDGRNPVRIAAAAPHLRGECRTYTADGPMWAPDGRHLAYREEGNDSCPGRVSISDPDGRDVVSFPGAGRIVAWSPDATRVAVRTDTDQIGIYGIDGVRRALIDVPRRDVLFRPYSDPVWSPEGRSILLSIEVPDADSGLWELPVDGGTPRHLASDDPLSGPGAAFSHDGTSLSFVSDSLVVIGLDGSQRRVVVAAEPGAASQLGAGPSYGPHLWSPGDDRIAFTWSRDRVGGAPGPTTNDLRVVDLASGRQTTLTTGPLVEPLAWSPEGDRLLFRRTDELGISSLWSINADGSNVRLLVDGATNGDWQWLSGGD